MSTAKSLVVFIILLLTGLVWGSPPVGQRNTRGAGPLVSSGDGPFFFIDYASFKGEKTGTTVVELYLEVNYDGLQFIKNRASFLAVYDIDLSIANADDQLVAGYTARDSVTVATYKETKSSGRSRVLQLNFFLMPGQYSLQTKISDLETQHTSMIKSQLSVRDFLSPRLQISEIQLSRKIHVSQMESPFVKNNQYIEPNVSRRFAAGMEDIYAYFEIYNLNHDSTHYSVSYTIYNRRKKVVFETDRSHSKSTQTLAHTLRFPSAQFPEGVYRLAIRIQDSATGEVAELSRSFYVWDSKKAVVTNL